MNNLSEEQKILINKKIEEGLTDYVVIANLLFNREDLQGRSKEAKLIRDYMISCGSLGKKEKAILFAICFLVIAISGAGKVSFDRH